MGYKVGISTGFWGIGKDPALLGLAQKIAGLGATGGIRFVQVDLERLAEFYEPDVKKEIERMKTKLGMIAGLHGDISHFSLDTAEKQAWEQTHYRLCQTMRFAAELGFFYVNYHFSSRPLIQFNEPQQRIQGYFTPVVDPYGRPLNALVRGNEEAEKEAMKHLEPRFIFSSENAQKVLRKEIERLQRQIEPITEERYERFLRENPNASEEEKKIAKQRIRMDVERDIALEIQNIQRNPPPELQLEAWKKIEKNEYPAYILEDGEFGAFIIVGEWMRNRGDYLWKSIVGNGKSSIDLYTSSDQYDNLKFHAAVVSKYIEGHMLVKDHPANIAYLNGMSVKEWCEKKNVLLLLENPEAGEGAEGSYRLFLPNHFYHTIKNINSSHIKICIDFEHMVSQALNPDEIIKKLPGDFGKYLTLLHLGQPVPYGGTAHIPLSRATMAQEQIYRWAYEFRKRGWKDGYMIFERGGGRAGRGSLPQEVFEDSVTAIRQIARFLEMDYEPKNLPPEFYGVSYENKAVFAKQEVAIREHAWDPLEGTLRVPEEKHSFLSGFAVQTQKGQEWEKRKYR